MKEVGTDKENDRHRYEDIIIVEGEGKRRWR